MSRNLTINTTDRSQKKWSPSPDMAIREEDGDEDSTTPTQHLIEEDEDEDEEDDDEEEDDEDEDDEDGSNFTSSPSIPDENINFDLVYTLHTFEATVDGQASVKKGDALTLLDDSNSYWWLIRDLKTSEVGYIPAENIETPFERLARLNKHRNVELTSLEQAVHYIDKLPKKPISNKKKKVNLSTSLDVQLQVLFTGENNDDIEDEAYETWTEEMLEDDDSHQDDESNDQGDDVQSSTAASSKDPMPTKQPIDTKPNMNDKELPLIASELDQTQESPQEVAINKHASQPQPSAREGSANSKVLRVYAGNVDVGASYYSVRVTERTSVDELLTSAMEKFHISQLETQQGRHFGKHSCIEYYLTVKTRDGDEMILDPQDKPYAIHESLTAHLTTPMPSLTQLRQFASGNDYVKRKKKRVSSDFSLQFFMHKRIKRVNDKSGQVHIKVSLMTPTGSPVNEKMNAIKKMTTLGRFGKKKSGKKENAKPERIDKLIATPASITISELTSIALAKFHIISENNQPHSYRLMLNTNGKDTLLEPNDSLSTVLESVKSSTDEKLFILHNPFHSTEDQIIPSLSSTTKAATSSKVFPETSAHNRNHYLYRGHPVMTRLDSNTEAILKRINVALESFEIPPSHPTSPKISVHRFASPMSVSRSQDGIDIHLPHGLLRSTELTDKTTQYSLMKFPNTLVLQEVLSDQSYKPASSQSTNHTKTSVSGEEMAALIRYGSQYLDAYDAANKPAEAHSTHRLLGEKDASGKSLSSLEDLEKEFQRIISSHSS
ncbi:hypothetical protein BD560DRAFT_368980 [Blakeslea trispora]|nr:hypothetical protein BD560DRAFT_368980 [Blakeslea trispora]